MGTLMTSYALNKSTQFE